MDLSEERLLEISLDAADRSEELPLGCDTRLIEKAQLGSKHPLHPSWLTAELPISALDAFITTASQFGELVDTMEPGEWGLVTRVADASVRDLVIHLVGVERYVLGQLGRRDTFDAPRREDHWRVTQMAAADVLGLADSEISRLWWRTVLELIATCGELGPEHPIVYHHLGGTVSGFLVARTFELWTHGDDIRQALGRPLDLLDENRLALMVGELMGNLSIGLALAGTSQPGRTARFRLDGPGGGSFDAALAPGEAPGVVDLTIATSTIDLCRMAANRLSSADFHGSVAGDRGLLPAVMAGVSAFAAD